MREGLITLAAAGAGARSGVPAFDGRVREPGVRFGGAVVVEFASFLARDIVVGPSGHR